jgi:hypothetical protein
MAGRSGLAWLRYLPRERAGPAGDLGPHGHLGLDQQTEDLISVDDKVVVLLRWVGRGKASRAQGESRGQWFGRSGSRRSRGSSSSTAPRPWKPWGFGSSGSRLGRGRVARKSCKRAGTASAHTTYTVARCAKTRGGQTFRGHSGTEPLKPKAHPCWFPRTPPTSASVSPPEASNTRPRSCPGCRDPVSCGLMAIGPLQGHASGCAAPW